MTSLTKERAAHVVPERRQSNCSPHRFCCCCCCCCCCCWALRAHYPAVLNHQVRASVYDGVVSSSSSCSSPIGSLSHLRSLHEDAGLNLAGRTTLLSSSCIRSEYHWGPSPRPPQPGGAAALKKYLLIEVKATVLDLYLPICISGKKGKQQNAGHTPEHAACARRLAESAALGVPSACLFPYKYFIFILIELLLFDLMLFPGTNNMRADPNGSGRNRLSRPPGTRGLLSLFGSSQILFFVFKLNT